MKIVSNQVPEAPEIRTGVQVVTPAMATAWLEKNSNNRSVSDAHAQSLAEAMRRGEWRLTHQGIAFGADGTLYDGQHRLWAIINSGVSVMMMVTTGLDEASRADIDGARKRTVADNFQILEGVKGAKKLVELGNVILALVTHDYSIKCTYDQSRAAIEKYRAGIEWAAELPGGRTLLGAAPVRGALAFAYKTNPTRIIEFTEQLWSGANLGETDPAHVLRNLILVRRGTGSSGDRWELAVKVLRAAYAHLHGEKLRSLFATEDAIAFFGQAHGLQLAATARLMDHTKAKLRRGAKKAQE